MWAIFASPTYKATGPDGTDAMGPNVNLAPLLMEFGAVAPGRGPYFVIKHADRLRDR